MDLNKLKIGISGLDILSKFVTQRNQEKKEGIPIIPTISFKDIVKKIGKDFPTQAKVTDLAYAEETMGKDINQIKIIGKEGNDR